MSRRTGTAIHEDLLRVGRALRWSAVACGACWWIALCLGPWLGLFVLDNLVCLPPGIRLPLGGAAFAFTVGTFVTRVLRPVLRRSNPEQTARRVETRYGIADNVVISSCQMEKESPTRIESVFVRRTLAACRAAVARLSPALLWRWDALRRLLLPAAAIAAAWLIYALWMPRYAWNALARYAVPLGDIPPAASLVLEISPSTDIVVPEGEDLVLTARVQDAARSATEDVVPLLAWREGHGPVPSRLTEDVTPMQPCARGEGCFEYTFRNVRRPFALRVFAGRTFSRGIRVDVRALPRIRAASFRVRPPGYTGLRPLDLPGPPAAVSGLPGSSLIVTVQLDQHVGSLTWTTETAVVSFEDRKDAWRAPAAILSAVPYEILVADAGLTRPACIARGEVNLKSDRSPTIEFVTEDRNRLVSPGARLAVKVKAEDDYGIRAIAVTARSAGDDGRILKIKTWEYMGPPGLRGPVSEGAPVTVDPRLFSPGRTYLIEAACSDFSPAGRPGTARPIVLHVKSVTELRLPPGDCLAGAFSALRRAVLEQRKAHGLTGNLRVHLAEAEAGKRLDAHRASLHKQQRGARTEAGRALDAFRRLPDGKPYALSLDTLANKEMPWILADIDRVHAASGARLPPLIEAIAERQHYVLMELIALLGRVAEQRNALQGNVAVGDQTATPVPSAEDVGKTLHDDLQEFRRSQERILRRTRTLLDRTPEDLTAEEEAILGELAREEAKWAEFFKEKLTDFSKLPFQDFADGSLAEEFNEVFQEVQLAADALYKKNIELAVPQEQAGIENAEELIHNLERWLADMPDHLKWSMEEPPAPADVALAELPAELEDIVGELLDREDAMTEDVEDLTSSWLDSLDKGAGWTAMDGPISDMSAKGVTGNLLPNQQEVGGRAGEGRTGRSHGQMVEETAEGKKGRETPTRLSPSPFEPGSVEDSSTAETGGATGGGKLSGFAPDGLRGPAPPPRLEGMARLAGKQAAIRQEAETLALRLRAYSLPSGDLELSVNAMRRLERAAGKGEGLAVRRAFSEALDALTAANVAVRTEAGLHRERSRLRKWERAAIMSGLREGTPAGYEEMAAEYFRALAERPQR